MKQVFTRPTSGQYVQVWSWKGRIWSETLQVQADGSMRRYDIESDQWSRLLHPNEALEPEGSVVAWFTDTANPAAEALRRESLGTQTSQVCRQILAPFDVYDTAARVMSQQTVIHGDLATRRVADELERAFASDPTFDRTAWRAKVCSPDASVHD